VPFFLTCRTLFELSLATPSVGVIAARMEFVWTISSLLDQGTSQLIEEMRAVFVRLVSILTDTSDFKFAICFVLFCFVCLFVCLSVCLSV
jgi:hypothetical protein